MKSRIGKGDFLLRRKLLTGAITFNESPVDFSRQSGRTLAIGLSIVSKCISDYNTWYKVSDHHPNGDRNLLAMVFNIIEELNLEGFYYRKNDNAIMFDLKMENLQNGSVPGLLRLGN